jgi:hypothetical protein
VLFRLALSILHFNENSNRQVRVTERGEATYVMKFPKYKQGGYIVRAARVKATYGMQTVMYSLQSKVMSLIAQYRVITFDELFILYSNNLFVQANMQHIAVLG